MTPEQKARSILIRYGLENSPLTRLGGADNLNFRVDAAEPFVLRLRRPGRLDRAAVASELLWLDRLRRDTPLVVPEPVADIGGETLTGMTFAGETETLATLTRWLEGAIPPTGDALSSGQLKGAGAAMARLHAHARGFSPPEGFKRPSYDQAHFRRGARALFAALSRTELDRGELCDLEARAEQVIARFPGRERTPETFGLIHADFHSGNYVLLGDEVRVIDFDRCGFGPYLFDLALALMEFEFNEVQRRSFLRGYEAVAPPPAGYPDLMPGFSCLAYLDNLGFLAANPDELPFIVGEVPFFGEALRKATENLT